MLTMALAVAIGLSLGILGSGGSIVTLPVLVYVAGIPPKAAVGMSMGIVGATSLFGAFIQLRRANIDIKAALIFASTGMIGALIGSTGTHLMPKHVLMLLFAVLMMVVGSLMLRTAPIKSKATQCRVPRCLAVGLAVGVLTGFLGVGGGFLIVPALVLSAGMETRKAGGTSLAVIALNSTAGLIGQLRYTRVDWHLLWQFLVFAIVGIVAGIAVAHRMRDNILRRMFAMALVILALVIGLLNV